MCGEWACPITLPSKHNNDIVPENIFISDRDQVYPIQTLGWGKDMFKIMEYVDFPCETDSSP